MKCLVNILVNGEVRDYAFVSKETFAFACQFGHSGLETAGRIRVREIGCQLRLIKGQNIAYKILYSLLRVNCGQLPGRSDNASGLLSR